MSEVTRWKPTTGDINKIKMEVSDSGKYVKYSDYLALRQQLAEEKAKVADLTARLEAQEASESSFAGWQRRLKFSSNGEVHPWEQCSAHEATDRFDRSPRHEYRQIFTTTQPTPTVQAAVAAAYRKAAEAGEKVDKRLRENCKVVAIGAAESRQEILALPHDDSALREICLKVAAEAAAAATATLTHYPDTLEDIVDRVLGEKK